jgi:hypothetical protein
MAGWIERKVEKQNVMKGWTWMENGERSMGVGVSVGMRNPEGRVVSKLEEEGEDYDNGTS